MHDPMERIAKGIRKKRTAWILWALALVLIAAGILLPYKTYRQAVPLDTDQKELLSIRSEIWNPLAISGSVREYYLQTRKIGYDGEGRRIDEKTYICTA